jgi:hypothetical protein
LAAALHGIGIERHRLLTRADEDGSLFGHGFPAPGCTGLAGLARKL